MNVVKLFNISLGLLLVGWHGTSAEIFTSTELIRGVFIVQKAIANELKSYVSHEKERIAEVKRRVENFEKDSSIPENELMDLISNPVQVYRAVRQYQRESLGIDHLLGNEKIFNETAKKLNQWMSYMPSLDDYIGSIQCLLRLQETYGLSMRALLDISNGRNESILDLDDMFQIGRAADQNGKYETCLEWMNEALARVDKERTPMTKVDRPTLLGHLSFANYKLDNIDLALEQTLEFLKFEPNNQKAHQFVKHFKHLRKLQMPKGDLGQNEFKSQKQKTLTAEEQRNKIQYERYKLLCQGKKIKKIHLEEYLHCDYATNNDARLLIAPLKRETLHLDPLIVLYHDVISDNEIKFLKNTAIPKLQRPLARNATTGKIEYADNRVIRTAWINNKTDSYFLPRINRIVSQMTQLNLETAEDYQMVNYGLGGYYGPHLDHISNFTEAEDINKVGNRIATAMFYLSNVKAGGATVFPQLGVAAWPKKGSALFWFNLLKSGQPINWLVHAACPVIYGNKWVANKWFHSGGNELWHPCSTDPVARYSLSDIALKSVTH